MRPDAPQIALAAARLRDGKLVAFPTETVYGLGADALNADAVRRVFALKGRPSTNPLIVHVADIEGARRVVSQWPPAAERLARRFWPGPLTLVLPRAGIVPDEVSGGGPTVAVRCPDHPVAQELLTAFGGPIVGPSANLSGKVSSTTAQHVTDSFPGADLLVLDGGPCMRGIESTVLSLVDDEPQVLRLGAIPADALDLDDELEGIGATYIPPGHLEDEASGPLRSPGRLASHYAPDARALLFDPTDWPAVVTLARGKVVVLTHEPTRGVIDPHEVIRMPANPEAYAARLYAAVRQADAKKPSLIAIERPTERGGLWDAIHDRLERLTAERES